MNSYYLDYFWDQGIPFGRNPVESCENRIAYKIIMDPYRKHISIEKYKDEIFICTVYDSRFLDFRDLRKGEQLAWQKVPLDEKSYIIRNQDDRVVFKEIYTFIKNRCRKCDAYSPQGIKLSSQEMFYVDLGDNFNGVILKDIEDRVVLFKEYSIDPQTHEFSELIQENWKPEKDLPILREETMK